MITGIQIIGIVFGMFMGYLTFVQHKRKEFTKVEYAFWTILWMSIIIVMVVPQILDAISKIVDIRSKFDFIIVVAIMFLMSALFYTYTVIRSLQHRIEKLVREIALEQKK